MSFSGKTTEATIGDIVARYGHIFRIPVDSALVSRLRSFKEHNRTLMILPPMPAARMAVETLSELTAPRDSEIAEHPHSALVRRAQELIIANSGTQTGIREIASQIGISREHLSRIFREKTGTSVKRFMLDEKIRIAARLLRNTGLSCKEIAARTGFRDHSTFYRAFLRKMKTSPDKYRTPRG